MKEKVISSKRQITESKIEIVLNSLEELWEKRKGKTNEKITLIGFSNTATLLESCASFSKPFADIRKKVLDQSFGITNV